MQTNEQQGYPDHSEQPEHGRRPMDHYLQSRLARIALGTLQIINPARILEACQTLPAIGGADELLGDVARQPISGLGLEGEGEGLDQLTDGDGRRGQHDPGSEGQADDDRTSVSQETQVYGCPVYDRARQG